MGSLTGQLNIFIELSFFMMLQPMSILRKWNNASLKKAVRTFFRQIEIINKSVTKK